MSSDTKESHALRSRSRRRVAQGKRLVRRPLKMEDQELQEGWLNCRSVDRERDENDIDLRT